MVFLGFDFYGDSNSISPTATSVEDINYIEVKDGIYDELYITNDTKVNIDDEYPEQWDFNTILHANFNGNTIAGNVLWTVNNTDTLLLKRRKVGDSKWTTLEVHNIDTIDDFNFSTIDKYCSGETDYDFALVPVLAGIEGNYNISSVKSNFKGMIISDKDNSYYCICTGDDMFDTTRMVTSSTIELLNNKYPVYVSNTIANYDTGSCSGNFMQYDEENCQFYTDINNMTVYNKKLMDFLANRKFKILKVPDGRTWLIKVTGNPTDTGETVYHNRIISFEWTEMGDCTSEHDLYYANLLDVEKQYWSNS